MLWIMLVGGFALLLAGGELLVRGAVATASRLGVSPLVIGLTLVGFGTSTPELVTSLEAAFAGSPGIALGNVIGSNIANILLILGLAAVLAPIACKPAAFRRDGAVLVAASVIAAGIVAAGAVGRFAGAALIALLVVYTVATLIAERRRPDAAGEVYAEEAAAVAEPKLGLVAGIVVALVGIAVTILGARLLVSGATELALAAGISETVIGLTVVAVGTSLPELATSVIAAIKRQGDVAFGNVVGSNIYNILGILGVTAVVHPLDVPARLAGTDVWVMLGATGLLVAVTVTGWRITRAEGAGLMAIYAGYIAWLAIGA
ncbi:MAG: calcium/sodium antiporter [Azospirillaceae bacterium]